MFLIILFVLGYYFEDKACKLSRKDYEFSDYLNLFSQIGYCIETTKLKDSYLKYGEFIALFKNVTFRTINNFETPNNNQDIKKQLTIFMHEILTGNNELNNISTNAFVYNNRSAFFDLCKNIYEVYKDHDSYESIDDIKNKYNDNNKKEKSDDQENQNFTKRIQDICKSKKIVEFTDKIKYLILSMCIIALIFQFIGENPSFQSFTFNISAVLLLAFDLSERYVNKHFMDTEA